MKREVPPILGVLLVLAALTAVQILYWRGLITSPLESSASGGPRAGPGGAAPAGSEAVVVATVAGFPTPGWRDGQGQEARFDGPAAVAFDGANLYVADSRNHCVRRISSQGEVSTLAGEPGQEGYADGPARRARFRAPAGIAVAADGSIFVADTGNHRIRRIQGGRVETVAGSATPRDDLGREVGGYRDGPAAEAQFRFPVGLAADGSGGLYICDAGNHRVRYLSPGGQVSTLALEGRTQMETPTAVALTRDGLVVADTAGERLWSGPRGGPLRPWPRAEEGGPAQPSGLAVVRTAEGEVVVVADCLHHALYVARPGGGFALLAGREGAGQVGWEDGPGSTAQFSCPAGLVAGPADSIYVADFGNHCIREVASRERQEQKREVRRRGSEGAGAGRRGRWERRGGARRGR